MRNVSEQAEEGLTRPSFMTALDFCPHWEPDACNTQEPGPNMLAI